MSQKKRKRSEIDRRRCQVSELHLKGWSQQSIAQQLGVSQATICSDLKEIQRQWHATTVQNREQMKELEIRKQDQISTGAWRGFEKSFEPIETTKVIQDATGKRAEKTVRQQSGDPRFLEQIRRCGVERRAIHGLDSVGSSSPGGEDSPVSNEKQTMAQLMGKVEAGTAEKRMTDDERIERALEEDKKAQSEADGLQNDVP